MLIFLRDWLFKHTLGIDQNFGAFYRVQAAKVRADARLMKIRLPSAEPQDNGEKK
jgi:hemerythrin